MKGGDGGGEEDESKGGGVEEEVHERGCVNRDNEEEERGDWRERWKR